VSVDELLDPAVFAEKILKFKPFPYQVQLLRDKAKRIIVCAGRQVGKSTTIAAKALHFAATNPRTTTLIVSATLRQSMLMFDKILDFIEAGPLRRSVKYRTRTRVKFSNGSWIIALPSGRYGHTLRGHTAHLIILDEAAFIPIEVIENVVFPMLATTNGDCWMLSTPWGTDHTFYRAWNSPDWSKHHWPTSVNPLVSPQFLEEQKNLIGEERFRIEYLAEFVSEEDSFFPISLLRSCVEDYTPTLEPGLVWGYDPGGKDSMAAIVAVKWVGEKAYVMFHKAIKSDSYVTVDLMLADLHKQYPFSRLVFDRTGIGGPLEEHLRELGLPIEPVVITADRAQEMMFNMKALMENRKLALPNSFDLLNHLNAVTAEKSWSGRHLFRKRTGTYDDLAYALALALKEEKRGVIFVIQP
jgi:phage FluMu gp28-like protein